MKTPFCLLSALVLVLAGAGAARAQGGQAQQGASQPWMQLEKELGLQTTYSVDMSMQTMGMAMESRTVRSGGKTRTETTMPFMNLKMVALEIPQDGKTVSYSLFPDKKKYVVNAEADRARAAAAAGAAPKIEDLGTEDYQGEACLKRRIAMAPQGIATEMTMLLSPKQKNMPVKITMNATMPAGPGQPGRPVQSVVLFKNYDFSKPADSLFVLPADYVQAASVQAVMMEGMGNLGAMMQQMQKMQRTTPAE